jgi:hypothetical protein
LDFLLSFDAFHPAIQLFSVSPWIIVFLSTGTLTPVLITGTFAAFSVRATHLLLFEQTIHEIAIKFQISWKTTIEILAVTFLFKAIFIGRFRVFTA